MKLIKSFIFFILISAVPAMVLACPMCQSGYSPKSIFAYKIVTVFLTALPLVMGGSLVWWVRKRYKDSSNQHN
ncbi:MAG: hypothetical protein LC115_07905 [Bacteroidia bacterium]|nr:hypothetical protein [Bacteroidia bacterium]